MVVYILPKNISLYAIFNDQNFKDMLKTSLVMNNWAENGKQCRSGSNGSRSTLYVQVCLPKYLLFQYIFCFLVSAIFFFSVVFTSRCS